MAQARNKKPTTNKKTAASKPSVVASLRRRFQRNSAAGPRRADLPGSLTLLKRSLVAYRDNFVLLGGLTLIYFIGRVLIGGLPDTETYLGAKDVFGSFLQGNFSAIVGASAVIAGAFSGLFTPAYNGEQQVLISILGISFWLVLIWTMRQLMANNTVTVRLALYNAMTPLVPFLTVILILVLELLPGALGAYLLSFILASPNTGFEVVIFAVLAILLMALSLYLLVQSALALVIVTLPNTYPIAALRSAKLLVENRRVLLVKKLAAFAFYIAGIWIVISIPFLLLESLTGGNLTLIPFVAELLSSASLALSAIYLYLLYRELL